MSKVRPMKQSIGGVATVAAVVLAAAIAAEPAGGVTVSGALGLRGAGTTYAGTTDAAFTGGPSAIVGRTGAPGAPSKFSVKVLNNGTETASYVVGVLVGSPETPAVQLLDGRVDVTAAAEATGFATPSLGAGKSLFLTLVLTPPSGATPDQTFSASVFLHSSDRSTTFALVQAFVTPTATVGATDHDLLVKSTGQKEVLGEDGNWAGSETMRDGGETTFSVKTRNDSAESAGLTLTLSSADPCANFTDTVRRVTNPLASHSVDVTTQAFGAGYAFTAAPGTSTFFTVTIAADGPTPASCAGDYAAVFATLSDGQGSSQTVLITDAV